MQHFKIYPSASTLILTKSVMTTPFKSRKRRKYPLGMATVRARSKEKRVKAVALSGRRIRKTAG